MVALIRVRADGKGLGLKMELDGSQPVRVQTDPALRRQIPLNLVGNALKLTETGSVRMERIL